MTARRVYLAVIVTLLVVIAVLVYKFVVAGSTVAGDDGRTAVVLAPGERAFMLQEMREFVAGIAQLTGALSRNDMPAAADAAATMGAARAHDVPVAMMGKLPIGFKKLAFGVHRGFDAMAADARQFADRDHALGQLAGVLEQCATCHASYQIGAAAPR
ncbi:MAG TPA: hypothetical protein VJV77_09165 [Casimicrobiaceae bacterium]|nr:hypothetical protein [Casimicrobiaceae bacterium]